MTPREVMKGDIFHAVSRYGVTPDQLMSYRKPRKWAYPRQMAYTLLRDKYALSYPHIARLFNGRDHSTIIYGVRMHEARMEWVAFLMWAGNPDGQMNLFSEAA